MSFYRLFKSFMALLVLATMAGTGLWICVYSVCHEVNREADYQRRFGENWRAEYEDVFGSLSQARMRIAGGIVGAIAIASAGVWFLKVLRRQTGGHRSHSGSKRQTSKSRSRAHESPIARVVRYKRRALLGIYFGVPGILLSVLLTLFRFGIFVDHANEVALAIFIFLGAYGAVVTGCYWWVKAKNWHEAVVFIAFMPLVVFLIPFVRLLVFAAPQLMMATMVMMPLILVVVVAVLPDKSGLNRRRASWERREERSETARVEN